MNTRDLKLIHVVVAVVFSLSTRSSKCQENLLRNDTDTTNGKNGSDKFILPIGTFVFSFCVVLKLFVCNMQMFHRSVKH